MLNIIDRSIETLFDGINAIIPNVDPFVEFLWQDSNNIIIQNSYGGFILVGSEGNMRIFGSNGSSIDIDRNNSFIVNRNGSIIPINDIAVGSISIGENIISRTRSGSITISTEDGNHFARSASGALTISNSDGDTISRAASGALTISTVDENTISRTAGGRVDISIATREMGRVDISITQQEMSALVSTDYVNNASPMGLVGFFGSMWLTLIIMAVAIVLVLRSKSKKPIEEVQDLRDNTENREN